MLIEANLLQEDMVITAPALGRVIRIDSTDVPDVMAIFTPSTSGYPIPEEHWITRTELLEIEDY